MKFCIQKSIFLITILVLGIGVSHAINIKHNLYKKLAISTISKEIENKGGKLEKVLGIEVVSDTKYVVHLLANFDNKKLFLYTDIIYMLDKGWMLTWITVEGENDKIDLYVDVNR